MKKLLFVAAVASAFGLFAADEGVQDGTQVLEVGITAINSPLKNTVIAISYENLKGGLATADHLVKTTNLTPQDDTTEPKIKGDQLIAFDNGSYKTWTLQTVDNANVWVADNVELSNGDYGEGPNPAGYQVAYGSGIWLVRNGDLTKPFYIYGKPSDKTEVEITETMLIGNPWSVPASPVLVNDTTFGQGDQIAVPNDTPAPTRYTWNATKNVWGHVSKGKIVDGAPVIQPNTGAWFIKKDGSTDSATIRWEQKVEENN